MVSAFRFLNAATAAVESGALDDGRTYAATATDRLQTAIDEMPSVLGGLIPLGLELGLQYAIRYRHEALFGEAGLSGTVTGDVPRLHEQGLFGMVAEAMTNCARHASATTLNVEMEVVRGHLLVVIQDDGIGFDAARPPRRIQPERGLGLLGLYRQTRWFGGSARVISRSGRGTKVRISIPFERHHAAAGSMSSDVAFAAAGVAR